jgi:RNA polymerase sigma-70 factor, ECF subfamily
MTDAPWLELERDERERQLENHRVELTGFCYRMLGSSLEAEDAVQETLLRAWNGLDRFEGRASLRSWLYRIATNVCINMANGRKRRALPTDLTGPSPADAPLGAPLPEQHWIQPSPDGLVLDAASDPADAVASRETIRLAFIATLQYLPARQRAVLLLRDVLRWRTAEVADLLGTSAVSVKSALQRARITLATHNREEAEGSELSEPQRALLARYVDAFERYDIDELLSLLKHDATLSMPPYPMWLQGAPEIRAWWLHENTSCRGSKLVPVAANGSLAFAQYRPNGRYARLEAFAIQVLTCVDDGVTAIDTFVDSSLFSMFELPARVRR